MVDSSAPDTLTPEMALSVAVRRLGGQSAMARLLETSQSTVWEWLHRADPPQLPAEHVLKVEAATRVSRHDLRPDIYPRGLQDGVPFIPHPDLSAEPDLVAENGRPTFQADDAA